MKVRLVGVEVVSYTKKATGELKEGLSLYYTAPKRNVQGEGCDSLWIAKGTALYERMKQQDLSKPVMADLTYEVQPGSRFPALTEIKILAS